MNKEKKEYWITPPEIYKKLDQEFHFDYDPCPYPFNGIDGTETDWGRSVYLNPPFRKSDGEFGKGPTAFIRKAIEENKKGKQVVIMINTNAFINMLIEAGAEMRSMGRVKWLDGKTGEPWKSPSNTTCFILKSPTPKVPQGEKDWLQGLRLRLGYCQEQNGLDSCKNCGLNEKDLDKLRIVFLEATQRGRDGVLKEVSDTLTEMLTEYANTLIDKRGNGWNWILKARERVALLKSIKE